MSHLTTSSRSCNDGVAISLLLLLLPLDVSLRVSAAALSGELLPEDEVSERFTSSRPGSRAGTWLLQNTRVSLESSGLLKKVLSVSLTPQWWHLKQELW